MTKNPKEICTTLHVGELSQMADRKGSFFLGTSPFRIDSLRSHEKNFKHIMWNEKKSTYKDSSIEED